MRSSTTCAAAIVACVLLAGACGGGNGNASPSAPAPAPTPVPTPTPPIDGFAIAGSDPAPGGVIHTGVPPFSFTTGFKLTLSVTSAADRAANIQVFLESPRNGACLENASPSGGGGTDVELRAGVPVTVTIERWLVTSVCNYPNSITSLTARMMSSPDPLATPIYEERIAVQYTVTQ